MINRVFERLGLDKRKGEVQFLSNAFEKVCIEGFEDKLQRFESEKEERVRENWEEKKRNNPHIFPGPLGSVAAFKVVDETLKLWLRRTRFDLYDGLRNEAPSYLDSTKKPLDRDFPLPLSVGAVTVTDDNKIIFGIRSKATAFGKDGAVMLPSGYFNPDRDASVQELIRKELEEEVGIRDFEIERWGGLVYDGKVAKQPLLSLRIKVPHSSEEIEDIKGEIDKEVKNVHYVDNKIDAVKEFIDEYPPLPHSMANLVLHFYLP